MIQVFLKKAYARVTYCCLELYVVESSNILRLTKLKGFAESNKYDQLFVHHEEMTTIYFLVSN